MYKKIFIQLFLVLIVISIIGLIINFYFLDKDETVSNQKNIKKKIYISKDANEDSLPTNIIENLEYLSKDNNGNEYEIIAEKGEMNLDNSEIIYMSNVIATIRMKNTAPIIIKSDYANYNKRNYDTNFKDNVIINHLSHKVTGNNLDLSFENNIATMFNEIIYTNINTILNADRLEIDLITKNSKIFMNDKYEKIKLLVN